MNRAFTVSLAAWITLAWAGSSMAADPVPTQPPTKPNDSLSPPAATHDVRTDVPVLAYAYTAYGASAKSIGAQLYGIGSIASDQRGLAAGGATIWGSPIDRLTIIGDAARNTYGNFSPSVGVVVRLLGTPRDGWSLGALGKFKVDGFAGGPTKDEMESELETGLLLSFARRGWHLDVNAISGFGLGDDGEIDFEGRLRFGREIGKFVRVGADGQARFRLAGPKYLPNKKTWDFSAGPQLQIGSKHFFGALTAGPATMGLFSEKVGWNAMVSVGGSTL